MAQLVVKEKWTIHILFALFSGSIAMGAAKQLTGASLGPFRI
ncbi:hypothetical protein [Agaribacterium sp. ZY112]